jgi:DNA-binding CsgD family transcriptional regulator
MLSSSNDDDLGVLCLRMGACGYLTKTINVESLPRAIRAAGDGEAVVPRRLTARLVDAVRRTPEDGAGLRPVRSPLTAREWEVLDLLCQGMSTDDIADALVLSSETVRSHVKSIQRPPHGIAGADARRVGVDVAAEPLGEPRPDPGDQRHRRRIAGGGADGGRHPAPRPPHVVAGAGARRGRGVVGGRGRSQLARRSSATTSSSSS